MPNVCNNFSFSTGKIWSCKPVNPHCLCLEIFVPLSSIINEQNPFLPFKFSNDKISSVYATHTATLPSRTTFIYDFFDQLSFQMVFWIYFNVTVKWWFAIRVYKNHCYFINNKCFSNL